MPSPQSDAEQLNRVREIGALTDAAIKSLAGHVGIDLASGSSVDMFEKYGENPSVLAIVNVVDAVRLCEAQRCIDIITAYRDEAQQLWYDFLICDPVISSRFDQRFSPEDLENARERGSVALQHAHAAKIANLIIKRISQTYEAGIL